MVPRQHPRVEFVEPVEVRIGDDTLNLMSLNISCGGIRLETNRPLLVGQRVSLQFATDAGPVQVREAEVIWSKPFEPISIDGVLPGMGMVFTNITVDDALHIQSTVDQRLAVLDEPPPTTKAEAFASELERELSLDAGQAVENPELWRPPDMDEVGRPKKRPKGSLRPLYIVAGASVLMGAAGITIGHWATSSASKPVAATTERVVSTPYVEPEPEPEPEAEPALQDPDPDLDLDLGADPVFVREPLTVLAFATGADPQYKYFDLQDPPRIVLDVYGAAPPDLPEPAEPVASIRMGQHPDRVRLVLDVSGDEVPVYDVVATSSGLEVRLLH